MAWKIITGVGGCYPIKFANLTTAHPVMVMNGWSAFLAKPSTAFPARTIL
jgi:hypothetical protein